MTAVERWSVPDGPAIGVRRWGGGGDPLVLVHGLSGSSAGYVGLGDRLAVAGWSVSAIDLRGHGVSDRVPGTYEIEHYAADVAAFVQSLGRPAVLVGHSLGGAISVYLAGGRPDLVRAAFAEDPPLYHGMPGVMASTQYPAVFAMLRDRMRALQDADATDDEIRAHLLAQPAPGGGTAADTSSPDTIEARVESLRRCDAAVWDPAIEGVALAGWDPERPVGVPLTVLRADPAMGPALTPDEAARFGAANSTANIIEIGGAPHGIREFTPTTEAYLDALDRFLEGL